ncbi:NAD-dependent epimerase/dehydratase family protein [Natrononativus amylolyticus]|uniref:NAD-dependent epimerase/dehydratase family protein n=1 Tax=Natrononativus amylolyticus TaxID=2963434 RepID=UPI0020CEB8DB|nr:NAD-dependent epimerase/dehydratase family protein [Natrononativus amylolyticus]
MVSIFVAGSTGVLGRRLVPQLTAAGHDAIGLVRDDAGAALVRDLSGEPRRGDVLEPATLVDAADGADVVIHAATAVPTATKPTAADWERNDRIRREGTRNLLAAAETVGADRFLLQSIVWLARQPDGRAFDEDATAHPDRTTASALEAERLLTETAETSGLEACTLRCGWFYAHDAVHTRRIGRRLLARRLPIIGAGLLGREDATLSYCHADDAASAFVAAAEGEATGTYHVVDDRPAPFAAFLRGLADRLEAPPPRRIPGWMARPLVGRDTVRLLTSGMPTTNERFGEAFDWEPALPTCGRGLERVVDRWLETGTLREDGDGYEWSGESAAQTQGSVSNSESDSRT